MRTYLNQKIEDFRQIPGPIWAISVATMLISVSAVMAFSVGPFFMTEVLGMSLLSLGSIEGFTEGLAQITRLFTGLSGDYFKKNKPMLIFGFILATLSKPFFILANGAPMIIASKIMERLSNGIMATPRDAFVSSAAPYGQRGRSLGLLMTMKTIGCTFGSLLIGGLLLLTQDYKLLLWIGFGVCFLGIFVLIKYVKEDTSIYSTQKTKQDSFRWAELKALNVHYWSLIMIAGVFMAARISDGFLILRFKELGGSTALCASLIGIFNLISAFCCYPIGRFSDQGPRSRLLGISFVALTLCHLCFAYATGTFIAMIGVLLWGVQRGTSQVLLTSIIADETPRNVIGTALGVFYLITGITACLSGALAGQLADTSLHYAFKYGFFVSLAALVALMVREKWAKKQLICQQEEASLIEEQESQRHAA